MAERKKTEADQQASESEWAKSTAKNPDDFPEQDEPMTEEQVEHLKLLSQEAGEPFTDTLTRGEAQRRIDALQRRTGNRP